MSSLALLLGILTVKPDLELDHVRTRINQMVQAKDKGGDQAEAPSEVTRVDNDFKRYRIENTLSLSPDWCFVDCKLCHYGMH